MYFPYFRGKREELFTIMESDPTIYSKVIPIIEPVELNTQNNINLEKICKKNIPFILIVNPTAHRAPNENEVRTQLVNNKLANHTNYHLGYIVESSTTRASIQGFLNSPNPHQKVLIHRGEYSGNLNDFNTFNPRLLYNVYNTHKVGDGYIQTTSANAQRVILQDGFERQSRNADYPQESDFSQLALNFRQSNHDGFGDYLTIGDYYRKSSGGNGAHVIAIHISNYYNQRIYVRHFLSEVDNTTTVNQGGKFLDAVESLDDYVQVTPHVMQTNGIRRYLDYHQRQHNCGPGMNKRLSMIHHVEQIASLF